MLSRFSFPLRGRALLWLASPPRVPLLEPWRAPALLLGALAGYVFFTVFFWGTLYYHLRTGAPWTNFTRFWRLVATNSDPTSGNALEQVPKMVMALSAGTLLAEEPTAGSAARIAVTVAAGVRARRVAWRRFERDGCPPTRPARPRNGGPAPRVARRVYVIVVDGANRERLWQAHTPTMDRLAREGTEYLAVEPAYPARTVVCFSSMLTGAAPAEHGMRSNFAPRLGVRCESVFDTLERAGRRGRLVGIAHLLDPFGEDVVRSVTSVQPTARIDHSLTAAGRTVVEEEDPDLLVLQLLAADQLGHVRGTRNPEYLDQIEETDRHVGDFLAFLGERGKLDDATVILMADHGQGRGIGGHGHLDWGERPVPFVVWGQGAVPGAVEPRAALGVRAGATPSALCSASTRPRPRAGARWSPPPTPRCARRRHGRALPRDRGRARRGAAAPAVLDARARRRRGHGRRRAGGRRRLAATPPPTSPARPGPRCSRIADSRGLGAALRTGLEHARDEGYDAAVYLDGDGEYDAAELARVLEPVARGRADYVLGSRFLGAARGHDLAPRPGQPRHHRAARHADGHRAHRRPDRLPRVLGHGAPRRADHPRLQLRPGADAVAVGRGHRPGRGADLLPPPQRRPLVRALPGVLRARGARALAPVPRLEDGQGHQRAPIPAASAYGQAESPKNGNSAVSGPNGASGRGVDEPAVPSSTSR